MTQHILARILILAFLVLTLSCSKESTESLNNSFDFSSKKVFNSKIVRSQHIPEVIQFIEEQSPNGKLEFAIQNERSDSRNHEEDLILTSVLTDQINQVTNSEGKSSYTFELIQGGDKSEIYFLNLIVKEFGDDMYLFIIKYVPDLEWLKSYKSEHDFAHFSGMIYYYNSAGIYLGKGIMNNGSSISTESRNACEDPENPNPDYSDSSNGGGGSTEGGIPIGDSPTGGGVYIIVVTVYHTIPTGETFEFGPGSVCQHPGECIVTVIVEFIYTEQDRTVRDLVDCQPPADCFDANGDQCPNGCDENNQCIEDPSEIEVSQSGILISSEMQRLADQLNNLIGQDNYEFFIPSSEEETISFADFQEFSYYFNNEANEFPFIDEELIEIDGQLRTTNYEFEVSDLFNTSIIVTVQGEVPDANSTETFEILQVESNLVGNNTLFQWEPYEFYEINTFPDDDLLRLELRGILTTGFDVDWLPFHVTRLYSMRIDFRLSTGETLNHILMSID